MVTTHANELIEVMHNAARNLQQVRYTTIHEHERMEYLNGIAVLAQELSFHFDKADIIQPGTLETLRQELSKTHPIAPFLPASLELVLTSLVQTKIENFDTDH